MDIATDVEVIDILYFLDEYRKRPCLWDKAVPTFKSRIARDAAENQLLRLFPILRNAKELRRKIRSIRGTYNNEARRIRNSMKSRAGAADIYKPKLFWFHSADAFLRSTTEFLSDSNLELEDSKNASLEDSARSMAYTPSQDFLPVSAEVSPAFSTPVTQTPRSRRTPRKSPAKINGRFRPYEKPLQKAVHALRETSEEEKDEFDVFSVSVATQLRKLPLHVALQLQATFQTMLSNARISNMQNIKKESIQNIASEYSSSSSEAGNSNHLTRPETQTKGTSRRARIEEVEYPEEVPPSFTFVMTPKNYDDDDETDFYD